MTITVACPACNTSFPVDPAKIPAGGVRAQCSACPEIFDVDEPSGESTFTEPTDDLSEAVPAEPEEMEVPHEPEEMEVPHEPEEMEVPHEVRSSFGADAEVVHDIAVETSDEFGEREFTFDTPVEMDEGAAAETEPEGEEDLGAIEIETPAEDAVVEADEAPAAEAAPIQFGKRTPEDKAKSLARSLVSDLIAYNPEKHTEALAAGTLVQVFGEEIQKSWKEYKDQVDPAVLAQGTFFNDALNELLANGESVFDVEG